ncbi:tubulin-folding cofactor B [Nymphaea colorata]|uniref:tubulin-folding cofactor B n=1 Tax=Nymphaea colorata TaxID=210225 RepID=UPI00129E1F57|nr:tubulin-folding cofactor B [Nymphaea colorata]
MAEGHLLKSSGQVTCQGQQMFYELLLNNTQYMIKFYDSLGKALNQNTTIKLAVEHNISSLKVIEARYDLNQTVLSVKENIEMRFGSVAAYTKLQLKDPKGALIAEMNDDMRTLGSYGAATGMVLYVIDLNPTSIHKEIESFEGVEKYVISEEDYDKLPENFRKWKKEMIKKYPQLLEQKQAVVATNQFDPDYMSELASTVSIGSRCKIESGARGSVAFVGKVVDLGPGYYVGVVLD